MSTRRLMWRDSGRPVCFFGLDGRTSIGILLVLLHFSIETIMFCAALMCFFYIIERFGYTFPNAIRRAELALGGKYKWSKNPIREKDHL